MVIEYKPFLYQSIKAIDGALTGTIIPGQAKKGFSTLHKFPEIEPHLQMKFIVITRSPILQGIQTAYSKLNHNSVPHI